MEWTRATTAGSSSLLRLFSFVFLRWIPGHLFPPLIFTSFIIYIVSFLQEFWKTSPYKVLADEVDIVVKDPPDPPPKDDLVNGVQDGDLQELDVQETVILEEKGPEPMKTLSLGLPSPTSIWLSVSTVLINLSLVLMTLDLVYRPLLYPEHDLSFARVGFVSDRTADVLIREPRLHQLPVFLNYRKIGYGDDAWKYSGQLKWLDNSTDFTGTLHITSLVPDTTYQYTSSNNHSGTFLTAPQTGQVSAKQGGKFTFLHTSCIKPRFPYAPFSHPLSIPGLQYLADVVPRLRAQFMLFLGDFIYIDVPKRHGTSVSTYRSEWRRIYASPDWPAAAKSLPWLHVIDDHEIANDWDANDTAPFPAALDAFTHYAASVNPPAHRRGASYYSFTQGPASFFMLDTRSHRSHLTDPDTTNKTMLGAAQISDLLAWLRAPLPQGVRWKFVISSVPFTRNWRVNGLDTWAGYLTERQLILEAMWDVGARGTGVVVLSGDRHEFAATAFPPPENGTWDTSVTVHEFSASPLSMFYLPVRTYKEKEGTDVMIKYIPDGNSKFGAVEISNPPAGEQSVLHYRLFVDGKEAWSHILLTPADANPHRKKWGSWA